MVPVVYWLALNGLSGPDVEAREIVLVPRGDNETVHTGRGGDHAVLDELIRGSVHQPTRFSKAARVHWQDLVGVRELIHPELNLRSSVGILLSGQLDAALQLPIVTAERNH